MRPKKLPILDHMLLQLVRRRLFLPLLIVWIAVIGGAGCFLMHTLVYQQQQIVKSMTKMVDRHLDQSARILDAVARVAESAAPEDIAVFMQSTWEAYQYFDTIYYLDENRRVAGMVPSDPMYLDLDMSNLPDFKHTDNCVAISRPFISMRTGVPTVYLVRPLSRNRCVVGELNLGAIQNEISISRGATGEEYFFILDQSGTLLAHPESDLVKQQTNMGYLEIFRKGLNGDAVLIYEYMGTKFMGNASRINRVGWVIVNQISLLALVGPYVIAFGMTIIMSLGIWLTLVWNLRKQLQQNVVAPLVQLSQSTNALAIGDYSKIGVLASMPTAFVELDRLVNDFQYMSEALRRVYDELEIRVQERTVALEKTNQALHKEISDRKYVEEALRAERSLFMGGPTIVFLWENIAGTPVEYVSPNVYQILGYPVEDFLSGKRSYMSIVHPDDLEHTMAQVLMHTNSGIDSFEQVHRIITASGETLWFLAFLVVKRNLSGKVTHYHGYMNDITERKVIETKMAQIDRLNAIGEVAAGMGHEIRNPMTTVRGYLQLFQRKEDFVKYHDQFGIMIGELDRANSIITEFLSLAKNKAVEKKQGNLNNVIQALFPILQAEVFQRGHQLQAELGEIPDSVFDEKEIRQLILNMVRNGLEAMEHSGLETIKTYYQNNNIILAIQDTGSGIPTEVLDKLGTPFVTTKDYGTGLGLSICYRIAARHDAVIEVSTGSEGTTFNIVFASSPSSIRN